MTDQITIRQSMERLDDLLKMHWAGNPKIHNKPLIQSSILKHGFNDPVTIAHFKTEAGEGKMLCAGHGRTSVLEELRLAGHAPPEHVMTDTDGMWKVPADNADFPSQEDALLYALIHNRSGSSRLALKDYDSAKLRAALGGQKEMPGFTDEDFDELGGVGTKPDAIAELPEYKAFDASALPDAPSAIPNVPETFVLFITFPTYAEMRETLATLSLGTRSGLPSVAKMCTLDGSLWLEKWKQFLPKEDIAVSLPPLIGNTPIEQAIAESPEKTDITEPLADPLVAAMTEMGAVVTLPENNKPVPEKGVAQSPVTSIKAAKKPEERKWIGGLCSNCGGSGNLGKGKATCSQCLGLGAEDVFNAHQRALAGQSG